MASGGKQQQRMVFDIRGRRRNVVKVVYAVLAVLMGLSLFLVVGGLNLGELFNSGGGSSEITKQFEEQETRIERELKKDPENPDLLAKLTRTRSTPAPASTKSRSPAREKNGSSPPKR